ncbi:unnamed protein product [Lampetra fluviatilis]
MGGAGASERASRGRQWHAGLAVKTAAQRVKGRERRTCHADEENSGGQGHVQGRMVPRSCLDSTLNEDDADD